METRTKALAAVDAGQTFQRIAAILGISTRWTSAWRPRGRAEPGAVAVVVW